MQHTIRPFAPADYEAAAQVEALAYQNGTTADDLRLRDANPDTNLKRGRLVAEVDGRVVGDWVFIPTSGAGALDRLCTTRSWRR